jgi:hypothetical protein
MTLNKPTNGSGRDSHAQITSHVLFQHPAGGELWVSSSPKGGMLIGITEAWNDDTEDCAALNIGIEGMRLLAYRLLAKAVELEVEAAR